MRKFLMTAMFVAIASLCAFAAKPKAEHVIFIGFDGWGSYSMPKADMPNVKKLMESGCYTLDKRTVLPSSSAPNWAAIYMGAPTEIHGYTTWGSKTPEIPSRVINKNNIFPTIFQIYRDARPSAEIGVINEWDGHNYLVDTLSLSYHKHVTDAGKYPLNTVKEAEKYIKEKKPQLLAVIFDQPDGVGHGAGHDTPQYYDTLNVVDRYVGRIVKAAEDAGIAENTIFIVTSDHGGIGTGHGGITLEEMRTPFIISGKNVKKGGAFPESMMQYDVASTIAYALGVEQPQVWTGRPMTQVFK